MKDDKTDEVSELKLIKAIPVQKLAKWLLLTLCQIRTLAMKHQ